MLVLCVSVLSPTHLIQQEVGMDLVLHQVGTTRWAAALVLEVGADALEAKRVATWGGKRIVYRLHTDGAGNIIRAEGHDCCSWWPQRTGLGHVCVWGPALTEAHREYYSMHLCLCNVG